MEPGEIEKRRVDHPNNNKLQVVVSQDLQVAQGDESNSSYSNEADEVYEISLSGVIRYKKFKYDNKEDVNDQNGSSDEDESALICYFNALPDELINNIFSYFDFDERFNFERVCKRWQHVNTTATWINMHVLNLRDKFNIYNDNVKDLTDDVLVSILKRCGRTLREIIFDLKYDNLSRSYLNHVVNYCPNLEIVNLSKTAVDVPGIKSLAERCKYLHTLKLDTCDGIEDESLWWLLKRRKKIKYLDLSRSLIAGEFFHLINDNLETLILNECFGVNSACFLQLQNRRIKHLNVNMCFLIDPETLQTVITSLSSTLTELHCRRPFGKCDNVNFVKIIERCHNLQHLDLAETRDLDRRLVYHIFKNCKQLRHLHLSDAYLADPDSEQFCQLPHLKTVILNFMDSIFDDFLIMLSEAANLEHVELRGNDYIGDRGCIALIENCPDLRLLDVSSCSNITDLIVDKAYGAERSIDSPLKIISGGTKITKFVNSCIVRVSRKDMCPFPRHTLTDDHADD